MHFPIAASSTPPVSFGSFFALIFIANLKKTLFVRLKLTKNKEREREKLSVNLWSLRLPSVKESNQSFLIFVFISVLTLSVGTDHLFLNKHNVSLFILIFGFNSSIIL